MALSESRQLCPERALRREVARTFLVEGAAAGLERLHALRESSPQLLGESLANVLGYCLLAEGKVAEAIEVFRLNVEVHPGSSNAHDSLGEAYLQAGETGRAARCYQRSLELDPRNANSRWMLARLAQPS